MKKLSISLVSLFFILPMQLMAVTYQGELSQSGVPYTGTADLEFSLFDAAVDGNVVGVVDLHNNVNVLNGRFMVELEQWVGEFDGADYWLEIAASIPAGTGGFTTLNPTQKIGPVPYAEYAYDLDVSGLQLRVDGTCGANSAIQMIDQNGNVSCGSFAAEDHGHEFSELTSVPSGLDDGDDDTTYNGADFALSNQSCTVGETVSGIGVNGTVMCVDLPENSLPPNCDQNNQALQYNTNIGWDCIDLTQIGGSAGQAQGFELVDSWGDTWDGYERGAATWVEAHQSCEVAGGRLPSITELYRVSSAFKGDVGNSYENNYLWSRTWWNKTNKTRVRLTDGNVTNSIETSFSPYRCVWPSQELNYFAGDQCMGEPGDACWDHVAYPNNTVSIDKMERPPVSYVAATDECAFVNAHLAEQQDYAENIINGLPNGSNSWQWTSNHARYDTSFIVRWQGVDTSYTDYDDPYVSWASRNGGPYKFRCAGVNYAAGSHPTTVANEFIADTTFIKASDAVTPVTTYGESISGCFNQGGHMAHSRDIMELARTGMTSGTGVDYIWLSDHSRYDFTQIGRWTGTDIAYTGYYSEYVSWNTIDLSTQYQHRCAFYPIDPNYTHPPDASCSSGFACQVFENGASKLAVDSFDRPAATYIAATQDCLNEGGRLPTTLQLTEAIRAGLSNGFDLSLWTSDSAGNDANASSQSIVLKWSGTEPTFSPIYPGSATWSNKQIGTTNNYRCVWSNEMR